MSFRLRIISGKGVGKEFVFSQPAVRIGRHADNDLVLYDTAVSRTHCEIVREGEGYKLRDIGSSNGVLLNDALVTESALSDGDTFLVGPVVFAFHPRREDGVVEPVSGPGNGRAFAPQSAVAQRLLEEQPTAYLPVQRAADVGRGRLGGAGRGRRMSRLGTQKILVLVAALLVTALAVVVGAR